MNCWRELGIINKSVLLFVVLDYCLSSSDWFSQWRKLWPSTEKLMNYWWVLLLGTSATCAVCLHATVCVCVCVVFHSSDKQWCIGDSDNVISRDAYISWWHLTVWREGTEWQSSVCVCVNLDVSVVSKHLWILTLIEVRFSLTRAENWSCTDFILLVRLHMHTCIW